MPGFGPFMRQLSETITRLARPFCGSRMKLSMTQSFVVKTPLACLLFSLHVLSINANFN